MNDIPHLGLFNETWKPAHNVGRQVVGAHLRNKRPRLVAEDRADLAHCVRLYTHNFRQERAKPLRKASRHGRSLCTRIVQLLADVALENHAHLRAGKTRHDLVRRHQLRANDLLDRVRDRLTLLREDGREQPTYRKVVGSGANAETKKELYTGTDAGWYGADVIQAAIGQSDNKFTPMQLCCYVSALANEGVRYKATFLSRVVSWDHQQLIEQHQPTVLSRWNMSDEAKTCIKTGMRLAATQGTGRKYFADYPIPVCCKTGTAQWSNAGSDHASFVLYAPADDPQIAIAVYVEKGANGGNLSNVCIPILDAYFSTTAKYETVLRENTAD